MVNLRLEALSTDAVPKDTFVSVSVGQVQKLARLSNARDYKFDDTAVGDRKFGRVEIYRRVGTASVGLKSSGLGDTLQEVSVQLSDAPSMKFNVRLGAKPEAQEKRQKEVEKLQKTEDNAKVRRAKQYLLEHNLEERLAEAMQAVLREKPEDPSQFIGSMLSKSAGDYKRLSSKIPAATTAPATATAPVTVTAPTISAPVIVMPSAPFYQLASVGPMMRHTPFKGKAQNKGAREEVKILPMAAYYKANYRTAESPGNLAARLFATQNKAAATSSQNELAKQGAREEVKILPMAAYYKVNYRTAESPGNLAARLFPTQNKAAATSSQNELAKQVDTSNFRTAEAPGNLAARLFPTQTKAAATSSQNELAKQGATEEVKILPMTAYYKANFITAEAPGNHAARLFPTQNKAAAPSRQNEPAKQGARAEEKIGSMTAYYKANFITAEAPGNHAARLFPTQNKASVTNRTSQEIETSKNNAREALAAALLDDPEKDSYIETSKRNAREALVAALLDDPEKVATESKRREEIVQGLSAAAAKATNPAVATALAKAAAGAAGKVATEAERRAEIVQGLSAAAVKATNPAVAAGLAKAAAGAAASEVLTESERRARIVQGLSEAAVKATNPAIAAGLAKAATGAAATEAWSQKPSVGTWLMPSPTNKKAVEAPTLKAAAKVVAAEPTSPQAWCQQPSIGTWLTPTSPKGKSPVEAPSLKAVPDVVAAKSDRSAEVSQVWRQKPSIGTWLMLTPTTTTTTTTTKERPVEASKSEATSDSMLATRLAGNSTKMPSWPNNGSQRPPAVVPLSTLYGSSFAGTGVRPNFVCI